jgi:alkanesulfonate monooxygenase SsuD/methylene tetrahydromethanopterin reductase-like flavin-dependent oxidoreductase (luciferase family)
MLLASAATTTTTIKLATTSYLLTLRNPLQAAEQVAVLDQLSGGRVLLGVGRGYAPEMLRAFHVPVAEKRRIFAWTLGLMKDAWAGAAISLDGEAENAVKVYPLPVQRPHPPIWVAAFGPKALAQAGRMGLPYLSSPMESLTTLAANYAKHQQASVEEGMTPAATIPLMRTVFVSNDAAEVAALKDRLGQQVDNTRLEAGESVDDWTLIGDPAFVRDGIQRYQETLGMTHLVATRLRLPGLAESDLRASVALLAETLA